MSYSYDGFGNRLEQTVTKGTAPQVSLAVSSSTNRIVSAGFGYDANGNLTAAPGSIVYSYDQHNRMVSFTPWGESYGYNHQNQRLWRDSGAFGPGREYYFYGAMGELLGAYELRLEVMTTSRRSG